MSLNRQFPLKYTSSILISLLELGPPFTPPVHLEPLDFKSRADWAWPVSTRWRHSILAGPYLPTWLALLRRSGEQKSGTRNWAPRGTGGCAYLFWVCDGWKTPQAMSRWVPRQVARSNSWASERGASGGAGWPWQHACALKPPLTIRQLKKRGGAWAGERGSGEMETAGGGGWSPSSPEYWLILAHQKHARSLCFAP